MPLNAYADITSLLLLASPMKRKPIVSEPGADASVTRDQIDEPVVADDFHALDQILRLEAARGESGPERIDFAAGPGVLDRFGEGPGLAGGEHAVLDHQERVALRHMPERRRHRAALERRLVDCVKRRHRLLPQKLRITSLSPMMRAISARSTRWIEGFSA